VTVLTALAPVYEIVISFALGFGLAMLMKFLFRWFRKPSNRICIVVGMVMLTYWMADLLQGSALLACMALGAVLVNIFSETDNIVKVTNAFTPPIFVLFFVISGAGFDISALAAIGIIGVLYVVLRVAGKMLGAWLGARVTHQEKKIQKYLGPTLMPQAGVALGLVIVAGQLVPEYAPEIQTIILCSTFIYSIIGPIAAKYALVKSGEIVLPPKEPKKLKKSDAV
jgi:Kef-type K+ transport system membrane component KefB